MPSESRRFLTTWLLFTYVFFSLTPGKRDQYILPALPAFALFCGWFFDMVLQSAKDSHYMRWTKAGGYVNAVIALLGAIALFGAAAIFIAPGHELPGWRGHLVESYQITMVDLSKAGFAYAGIVVALIGAALLWATAKRKVLGIFIGSALLMATISIYINGWVYPPMNPRKSGRIVSDKIMELRGGTDTPVACYDLFREDYIVYGDYFFKEIKEDNENGDPVLRDFLLQPRRVLVLMRSEAPKDLKEAHPDLPIRVLHEQAIGRRTIVIVDNGKQ